MCFNPTPGKRFWSLCTLARYASICGSLTLYILLEKLTMSCESPLTTMCLIPSAMKALRPQTSPLYSAMLLEILPWVPKHSWTA